MLNTIRPDGYSILRGRESDDKNGSPAQRLRFAKSRLRLVIQRSRWPSEKPALSRRHKPFVMNHRPREWSRPHILFGLAILALALGPSMLRADVGARESGLTAPATDEEIASLIVDLGDPAYEVRTAATRRLCAIGMPARTRLSKTAGGEDVEAALRAKKLLAVLDQIHFAGIDVLLSFSKSTIAWDESVDLRVTLINSSAHRGRVPFETDSTKRAERRKWSADALQVGDMLDVAEHLTVRGPQDREIALRVDDILADPRVEAAVRERLDAGPVSVIESEDSVAITVTAFNRGWARYPLLGRGRYDVVLEYLPPWEDDLLRTERIGRAVSNPATITVTDGAPAVVSRNGEEASVTIHQEECSLVATLVNKSDQPVWVNKNFSSAAPFAQGRWVYMLDESMVDVPVLPGRRARWTDFDEKLLVKVAPGGSVELARVDLDTIRRTLVDAGADLSSTRWAIHFSYSNPCDRHWQKREESTLRDDPDVPQVLRRPLPRRTLSTRQTSNQLQAPRTP